MSDYRSSIIRLQGDIDNVQKDAITLIDILNRQGSRIFLEILADQIGNVSVQFNLSEQESLTALNHLLEELKQLTLERI